MEEEPLSNVRRVQSLPIHGKDHQSCYDGRSPSAPPLTTSSREPISKKRRKLWGRPPEALPGPEDHPFFTTLSLISSSEYRPRVDSKTDVGIDRSTPTAYAYTYPPVYPHIPPPTLSLDDPALTWPTLPKVAPAASAELFQLDTKRAIITEEPEPVQSAEQESSYDSQASSSQRTATSAAAADNHSIAHVSDPHCTLHYVRAVPTDPSNGYALIHGQVWRSGDRRTGWRRNQWIVDGG